MMAGDRLERKSLSHMLWPPRKLRHILDASDARASGMDVRGVAVVK